MCRVPGPRLPDTANVRPRHPDVQGARLARNHALQAPIVPAPGQMRW